MAVISTSESFPPMRLSQKLLMAAGACSKHEAFGVNEIEVESNFNFAVASNFDIEEVNGR
jgi:hypothetical protein